MPLHAQILFYAIPGFLLTMALEIWWDRRKGTGHYAPKDALTSVGLGLGFLVVSAGWGILTWAAYSFGYAHRLFEIPFTGWSLVLLVVLEDHSYYWYHRLSHEVPSFWAAHVAHHSSEHYTLATALRQPWTTGWYAWIFWTPLCLLGFHPGWVLAQQAANLVYQYWIHTPFVGKLGPFGWVFNTPSHHRVHHGSNPRYIDRNHAGIFILWDRLYGSFEPETEAVVYGITKPVRSHNLLWLNLHVYADLWREARQSGSLWGGLKVCFQRRARVQQRDLP
ncbi:MAG: sterol desaturase family protein [Planctomycetes bacterium]|nr:sterol desaturase family protein [Planctomycetota bacterium]